MFLKIFNSYVLAILLEKKLFPSVVSTNMFQLPLWNLKKKQLLPNRQNFLHRVRDFFHEETPN